MSEPLSRFNINAVREMFILAEPKYDAMVRKLVAPFSFITPRSARDFVADRSELFFLVAAIDFNSSKQTQEMVRLFSSSDLSLAHKLVFVASPETLSPEQLLLLTELGVKYATFGPQRNEEFREHVKRICVEKHHAGSLEAFAVDIEEMQKRLDMNGLRAVITKLRELAPNNEEALRLIAIASTYTGEIKRAEAALKQILAMNSQNLWAANMLGKIFLRSGRAALGMETLKKISRFHELNSDRLLTLGNAAVNAGDFKTAQAALTKGDQLTGGGDPRFAEGLAKVKLAEHDSKGALAILAGRGFSADVISFLNMRAVMAIRAGLIEEGLRYYDNALDGVGKDGVVRSKIKFNIGIAYVRSNDLDKAAVAFRESLELGGKAFQRAQGPLKVIEQVTKSQAKGYVATADETEQIVDGVEWETMY